MREPGAVVSTDNTEVVSTGKGALQTCIGLYLT